ncbi:hypothetical protein FRB94_001976 [Tulasnella sp. JGI-2019a]|nr:hypothetical protein FRB93_010074 [Tulasnella sp. JGI-2019a]KAG9004938.1 hypothetical protein FRB94_001976 [Tulasnella sp. JGI-2019a]KAG9030149.1 hypothetical protein FRB95_004287 [Tulasnella sp. JGI-2019a]
MASTSRLSSSSLVTTIRSRTASWTAPERAKVLINALVGPSNTSLLPFIPRPIKLFVAFIFLLNWRSWPFLWHYKVLSSILKLEISRRIYGRTPEKHRQWLGKISNIGGSPFELVSKIQCHAGIDDIDYNGHLSNSSYAKACDAGRIRAACEIFPAVFTDGVWAFLGSSSFYFIREIPYGANYEITTTIEGWDQKWMYLAHHFITYPSKSSKKVKARKVEHQQQGGESSFPHLTMPSTPSQIDSPPSNNSPTKKSISLPYKAPGTVPPHMVKRALPEGAQVHCVAISSYCLKIGRITAPPAVVFIAGGFGEPSKQRWFHVQDLRFSKKYEPASTKPPVVRNQMRDVLRGGWKTEQVEGWETNPETGVSRFWELEEYEDRRAENMKEIYGAVQSGLRNLKDKGY